MYKAKVGVSNCYRVILPPSGRFAFWQSGAAALISYNLNKMSNDKIAQMDTTEWYWFNNLCCLITGIIACFLSFFSTNQTRPNVKAKMELIYSTWCFYPLRSMVTTYFLDTTIVIIITWECLYCNWAVLFLWINCAISCYVKYFLPNVFFLICVGTALECWFIFALKRLTMQFL